MASPSSCNICLQILTIQKMSVLAELLKLLVNVLTVLQEEAAPLRLEVDWLKP